MPNKKDIAKDTLVSTDQVRTLMEAMRAMADGCDSALDRMENAGLKAAASKNYQSALGGFRLIVRFVNGLAGTATTQSHAELIEKPLEELRQIEAAAKADVQRLKHRVNQERKQN